MFIVGMMIGGCYLYGGRVPTHHDVWADVPWSTSITREQLEAELPSKPFHLPLLTDVDTESDLHRVEAEMPEVLNKPQKQLIEWINKLATAIIP